MIRPLFLASTALVLAVGLFAGPIALLGCGDGEEWKNVKKESGEAWDAVKSWSVARRRDAEAFFSESMATVARKLEGTKASAAKSEAAKSLEAKRDDVARKLEALRVAGADTWEDARDAFTAAYESLQRDLAANP